MPHVPRNSTVKRWQTCYRPSSSSIGTNNQNTLLDRKDSFKDLGVVIDEKLTFRDHMHDKINKAYVTLGIIKRNFNYLTISSFVLLYKSMVRSHLDYCS